MRIFIIDDSETNLQLFAPMVERLGSDIATSCYLDPRVALEDCHKAMPDLVIVDYMMPGMDGCEFIASVRKLPGADNVPIVMVTGDVERAVRHRALDAGATDFLTKPVAPYEMRARLGNLIALRRAHLLTDDRNRWLADEVRRATATIAQREKELITRLARAAEFRDPETGAHIQRMALYSQIIARNLGLSEEARDLILGAAPMHDIGKLGIPDLILLKPARLSENEFSIMKQHTIIGHAILSGSESPLIRQGAEIALAHHEKYDGSGYPAGLVGKDIPLTGRIVAVADVFDALTSERPYKAAWDAERARAMVCENRGTHFDPDCVDAFIAAWDEVIAIHRALADAAVPAHSSAIPDQLA